MIVLIMFDFDSKNLAHRIASKFHPQKLLNSTEFNDKHQRFLNEVFVETSHLRIKQDPVKLDLMDSSI